MPNLRYTQQNQLNVSQAISNSTVDSYRNPRPVLPMCPMPISSCDSDGQNVELQHSNISNGQVQNPPSFNLVKLFIKQKSHSSDTCMDVSSGCWPSDSSSSHEHKQRKKSMNDSGKGSALSRHDEDIETSFQYDSLDVAQQHQDNGTGGGGKAKTNDLYREVFDSPAYRNLKECNLNIKNFTMRHNLNNNNSIERDSLKETNTKSDETSRTSENVTEIYHKTKIPLDAITRSIQTSLISQERYNLVPPSFLAKLNKLGDKQKAPVYVIYPNYTLPDLDFVNAPSDIILSPLGYKEAFSAKKKRPTSFVEAENLKNIDYKHVADWKSLMTLLPTEYYKYFKKNIPDDKSEDLSSQRPLFCMTPPIKKSRTCATCDCGNYIQTTDLSSESSHPPSSGYRGSSTMLDDSEINNESFAHHPFDLNDPTVERPPSGRTPRGILRRNNSANQKGKPKRNSMIEEMQQQYQYEKRRSVQDPYYMPEGHNIIQDYIAEMDDMEIAQRYKNKLPNRPHTSPLNDLHEFSELEINKAIHNRLNQMNTTFNKTESDMEARIRAENFLCNVPKSELKYYAEVANLLETMDDNTQNYDRVKLKNDVSRALSKKVSFIRNNSSHDNNIEYSSNFLAAPTKMFTTPPNSPNMSVAVSRMEHAKLDREKQEKINHNRFKRLQIQWELLSKDAETLQRELETKSGGSTPTSGGLPKSRIPRPVSYPSPK